MAESYVQYELTDGFIMNWLAAGPQVLPNSLSTNPLNTGQKQAIAEQFFTDKYEVTSSPIERGPLDTGILKIGDYSANWNYYFCQEDHLVDLSSSFPASAFVRAWAFSHLAIEEAGDATFSLYTEGPADIWINKKSVLHYAGFPESRTQVEFKVALKKGVNKILVRLANVATPDAVLAMGLKVDLASERAQVRIPTLIPSIERRNDLENIYSQIYLEREIHAANNVITLCFPENLPGPSLTDVRIQTPSGRIYGQAEDVGKPGTQTKLGSPPSLPGTQFQVLIMPRAWEYYESHIRISKKLDLWSLGRQRFSQTPYNTLAERQKEALNYAASVEDNIYSQFAKMALGKWTDLESKTINQSLLNIQQRGSGCEIELLGFLGVLTRHRDNSQFPDWVKEQGKQAALNFIYSNAGDDDRQILLLACQILAGQAYPEDGFSQTGLVGAQMCKLAEDRAIAWMRSRGSSGFASWDSKSEYALILASLAHLIDLAQTSEVWELGSVLMDKILYTIALNSINGVYGSAQGCACTTDIKSGLLEPTSGITRVMWGMGMLNFHIAGTVSMACLENYELPPIIAEIAAQRPAELLNKEQQAAGPYPVNKITYRTPNYMLSSAQSYRPGEAGSREQVWQATLGPQSIVFTNHPGCSTENDVHAPNYWLGNAVFPRVAQWNDTLVSIYNSPEDLGMDFTHAYFPTIEFDEFVIEGNTAFARKDEGFIALTAANGLTQITSGTNAFRELRSPGRKNIWICQLGRSAEDGDFQAFISAVLAQEKSFQELAVDIKTRKGGAFSFGWNAPFMYNNVEQSLTGFPHYQNPYTVADLPCSQMDITNTEFLLRLKFDDLPSDEAGLSQ
jgi:hypothetical protein